MTVPRRDIRENLWLALDTLRSHKFRAFLTVLGVLIGTATVIGVASIFQGLDREVVELASQFGTRTIFVYKIELSPGHRLTREERLRKPLTYEDGMAIREQCPSVEAVSVMIFGEFTQFGLTPPSVKYKGKEMLDAQFSGVTPEHIYLVNATLSDGRFFNATDETHRRDVAVIGDQVVQRFFEHEDPIGKSILVNGRSFQVIGVFDKFKELLGNNSDDRTVLVPYSTYKKLFPNAKENFISVLASRGKVDQALDELTGLLRRRRNVKPSEPDNFGTATAESFIREFRAIMSTVVLVTVIISSIGLLVGGIGVMNIMLVSVTERTREIGVRKAIGARRRDITWQFLLEAVALTGAGGVLGIFSGCTLSFLIRAFIPQLPSAVPLWSVVAGFLVAVTIGLLFGMWPAVKAARLDPIAALRYE